MESQWTSRLKRIYTLCTSYYRSHNKPLYSDRKTIDKQQIVFEFDKLVFETVYKR